MDPTRRQWIYLRTMLGWLLFSTSAVLAISWRDPIHRAVVLMGCGLVWGWVILAGGLMWRFRDTLCRAAAAVRLPWRLRFILLATLLALLEEAITTGLTNLAPALGIRMGQAYITASANYLDVVCLHSVVLFIPMFVGWAYLLSRWDFPPFWVAALFGVTGTLAEMSFGGPAHAAEFAMWSFVYGLMVWIPARSIPANRAARRPPRWAYPVAVLLPPLFNLIVPLGLLAGLLAPNHPRLHFPPIR